VNARGTTSSLKPHQHRTDRGNNVARHRGWSVPLASIRCEHWTPHSGAREQLTLPIKPVMGWLRLFSNSHVHCINMVISHKRCKMELLLWAKNGNNVEATFDIVERTKFYNRIVRHCYCLWQQSRMLLRQSRTLLRQCWLLLRHCCWCGRGLRRAINKSLRLSQLEIRSVERGICPIANPQRPNCSYNIQ